MTKRTNVALEKLDNLILDLHTKATDKKQIKITKLCVQYKVHAETSSSLQKLGFLTKRGIGEYEFTLRSNGRFYNIEDVSDLVHKKNIDTVNSRLKDKRQDTKNVAFLSNKVPLSPIIESVTDILSIALNYDIKPEKYKDFIKEILNLKLQNFN